MVPMEARWAESGVSVGELREKTRVHGEPDHSLLLKQAVALHCVLDSLLLLEDKL